MSKLVIVGVAAGAYILGAKAGRERYEQIAGQAQRLWSDPRVQRAAETATQQVRNAVPGSDDSASDASSESARTRADGKTRAS